MEGGYFSHCGAYCQDLTRLCLILCTLVKLREKAGPAVSCYITWAGPVHTVAKASRHKQVRRPVALHLVCRLQCLWRFDLPLLLDILLSPLTSIEWYLRGSIAK